MAETRFELCLDQVLQWEGGYADHPSDPGGATNLGITRKTLARWRAVTPWWSLAKTEVQNLERSEAAKIYKGAYWDRINAEKVPAGLDLALFDFAVNSGPDRAIKSLQRQLKVVADGQVGPLTLDAIKTAIALKGTAGLIDALCDQRLDFLTRLTTFAVFGKGWTTRVAAIRKAALAAAGATPSRSTEPQTWSRTMAIFSGYKTYIVAAFMLIAGLAQVLGIDLPSLDGASAGHLIMESLAVIFLRQGVKGDIGKA
ncbi:glycoside hydrolase family 108 protein [uncultured Devosia sp.]|uniref:glycoside hydrolase family 108 protein n=1 Tax=uncultured Devosia sp. TaxID=211434 RepID=UPI0035C9F96A